jgi:hypothetical protein
MSRQPRRWQLPDEQLARIARESAVKGTLPAILQLVDRGERRYVVWRAMLQPSHHRRLECCA